MVELYISCSKGANHRRTQLPQLNGPRLGNRCELKLQM